MESPKNRRRRRQTAVGGALPGREQRDAWPRPGSAPSSPAALGQWDWICDRPGAGERSLPSALYPHQACSGVSRPSVPVSTPFPAPSLQGPSEPAAWPHPTATWEPLPAPLSEGQPARVLLKPESPPAAPCRPRPVAPGWEAVGTGGLWPGAESRLLRTGPGPPWNPEGPRRLGSREGLCMDLGCLPPGGPPRDVLGARPQQAPPRSRVGRDARGGRLAAKASLRKAVSCHSGDSVHVSEKKTRPLPFMASLLLLPGLPEMLSLGLGPGLYVLFLMTSPETAQRAAFTDHLLHAWPWVRAAFMDHLLHTWPWVRQHL